MDTGYGKDTINIIDLLYRLISKWRILLLCMIMGALALGITDYVKSYKAVKQAQESGDAVSAAEGLSAVEKNKVDNLYISASEYQRTIDDTKAYLDNSILMNLDDSNIEEGTAVFIIKKEKAANGEMSNLKKYYEKTILNEDLIDNIYNALESREENIGTKNNINKNYLSELIDISDMNSKVQSNNANVGNNSIEQIDGINELSTQEIFTVRVYGYNKKFCQLMMELIQKRIDNIQKQAIEQFGKHELSCSTISYVMGVNSDIYTIKKDKTTVIADNQSRLTNLVNNEDLSDGQVAYLNELLLPDKEKAGNSQEEGMVSKPTVSISKKKVLFGMILGLGIPCFIYIIIYMMSGKIYTSQELEVIYGLNNLGYLSSEKKKKKRSVIDRTIDKIFFGAPEDLSNDEMLSRIKAELTAIFQKDSLQNIALVGSCINSEDNMPIQQLVGDYKNANVIYLDSILKNPESILKMADVDAIILIEKLNESLKRDLKKELDLISKQKVTVIGTILFD